MLAELEHIYHNTQPIYVLFSLTTLKIIVQSITSFLKVWNKTNCLLFFFYPWLCHIITLYDSEWAFENLSLQYKYCIYKNHCVIDSLITDFEPSFHIAFNSFY